jgi:subtilase family serine protease
VTVKNDGRAPAASGATVTLSLQEPATGAATTIGQTTLSALTGGSSQKVSFTWSTAGVNGARYLVAEADSAKQVKESNENNNSLAQAVTVTPKVDLAVTANDLTYSPEDPGTTETITISAQIRNAGGTDASGVVVRFILDPATTATQLSEQTIDLSAGAVKSLTASTTLALGTHEIQVVVDPEDQLSEGIETNNAASLTIEMKPRIDLVLTSSQVRLSPTSVVEPDPVNVSATIYNQREDSAANVTVRVSMYDPATMTSIDQRVPVAPDQVIPTMAGNSAATVYFTASTAGYSGTCYLVVDVDPKDTIEETHEDNNRGQAVVSITPQGNLNITSSDFSPPSTLTEGATTTLKATLRNNGGATLSNFTVLFTANGPSGPIQIGSHTLSALPPNTYTTTPGLAWDTTGLPSGQYTLSVTLDPGNAVAEKSETDNKVDKTLTLNPRADLSIAAGDIAIAPAAPEEGDAVTITATIKDLTATTASGTFLVRFFEGDPTGGGTQIGADISRTNLSGNTSFTASVTWDTTNKPGSTSIYVQVDPTDVISELNEINNLAYKTVSVTKAYRPDLAITDSDLSLSPSGGVSPGQTVQVKGTVSNLRNYAASGAVVRLYQGDPASGGTQAAPDQTINVPALGSTPVAFSWTTPSSTLTTQLYVVVDPAGAINEPDETNNKASILYRGRSGADTTPRSLTASVNYHTVTLGWLAPTNAASTLGYHLYRDGVSLNPTADVTAGATATADSTYSSSYPASNAIDGSSSSYWFSSSHAAP